MGCEVRAHDWSSTPLGPLESWPQSLRTSVGMLINNIEPKALTWGPDFLTIHNDSYLPFVRPPRPHGIGAPFPDVCPDLWPVLAGLFDEAKKGRGTCIPNLPVTRGDDTSYFLFSSSPAFDESNAIAGVKIVLVDMTSVVQDQLALARDRNRLRALLDRSSEQTRPRDRVQLLRNDLSRASAMEVMASVLAHEVNQPITAAANFVRGARRALERGNQEVARAGLDQADETLMYAGSIVGRIRSMVAGGEVSRQATDMAALVRHACALAGMGGAADMTFELDLPDGLSAMADPTQIEQVILNLVRNAGEAMVGSAERRLRIAASRDGAMIATSFADTGPGIAPEVRDGLFVPFVTSKSEGLGVGLSISRTIIEAHGGQLTAENAPGGGALFRFTLPAAG